VEHLGHRALGDHQAGAAGAHQPRSLDSPELSRTLAKIVVWPIDLDVCRAIPTLDFRGDPADEIIAATSVVHRLPLLTRDRAIRRSRRVPLA
jgi:PIN domain nuclease of toxin-antitoxin system